MERPVFSVSEFVAVTNQTLEYALTHVVIEGEVSEYRVSKGRWVYFKLKDQNSSVAFFGTVFQMNFPVEDGMLVRVNGTPRLHNKYGFSVNVQSITPSGEGGIKKAFELLKKQLEAEGLFDETRKRAIPEIPKRIGLITSAQAAAYEDFMKILSQRWGDVEVLHVDVQVQGEVAPQQIVAAIEQLNTQKEPVDVLVLTRGGGSAEDLMAFSSEQVVRAIAASRAPTIVGVGHEIDISLADLVADERATTPTNAAQLVVPNKLEMMQKCTTVQSRLQTDIENRLTLLARQVMHAVNRLTHGVQQPRAHIVATQKELLFSMKYQLSQMQSRFDNAAKTLSAYDPRRMLQRGYSLVRSEDGTVITDTSHVQVGQQLMVELNTGTINTEVKDVR